MAVLVADDVPAGVAATLRAAGCVFAEEEAALLLAAAGDQDELAGLVARRVAGEPLEWIIRSVQFCGARLTVAPGVFVPRRRTEFLADLACAAARRRGPRPVVVELCCGAAPIAATVARRIPAAEVHAADIDPAATACAQENLAGRGTVHQGDLDHALPARLRGRVAVLAVNAPYVPTRQIGQLPPEARDHEPWIALDGGSDGLDVQRRIAAAAPGWLAPDGLVLIETSREQAEGTAPLLAAAGLTVDIRHDPNRGATVARGARYAQARAASRPGRIRPPAPTRMDRVDDGDSGAAADLELARRIARAAGDRLLELRASWPEFAQSDKKARRALMDAGDAAAQSLIAQWLVQERPGDAVLSEEAPDSPVRLGADRVWIIDPLDGTSEFGQLRADFAVHVALWQRGQAPQRGGLTDAVVDVPARGEIWDTAPGAGPAPLPTDRPLKMVVSRSRRPAGLDDVLAAVTSAAISSGVNPAGMVEANVGSVGAKLGEVMAGRAEAYLHPGGLNEWDLAAPFACALARGYVAIRGAGQLFNAMPPVAGPVLIAHPDLVALFQVPR